MTDLLVWLAGRGVQVALAQRGRPLLNDAQIDDLVAWLVTLR